jgi:hypothetical protein
MSGKQLEQRGRRCLLHPGDDDVDTPVHARRIMHRPIADHNHYLNP